MNTIPRELLFEILSFLPYCIDSPLPLICKEWSAIYRETHRQKAIAFAATYKPTRIEFIMNRAIKNMRIDLERESEQQYCLAVFGKKRYDEEWVGRLLSCSFMIDGKDALKSTDQQLKEKIKSGILEEDFLIIGGYLNQNGIQAAFRLTYATPALDEELAELIPRFFR